MSADFETSKFMQNRVFSNLQRLCASREIDRFGRKMCQKKRYLMG